MHALLRRAGAKRCFIRMPHNNNNNNNNNNDSSSSSSGSSSSSRIDSSNHGNSSCRAAGPPGCQGRGGRHAMGRLIISRCGIVEVCWLSRNKVVQS